MEDDYINTTPQDNVSFSYINTTSQDNVTYDYHDDTNIAMSYSLGLNMNMNMNLNMNMNMNNLSIIDVVTCIIISISLPLILMVIYALYATVRNDHVAPIYIINLLISDLIQLCCIIVDVAGTSDIYVNLIYYFGLISSVAFMVCVSLERYLLIVFPLWYHFRRSIKVSVVVCVLVWVLPLVVVLRVHFSANYKVAETIFFVFLLLPFPLLIFFLAGTLKALSTSRVSSDKKRRIVSILVLVLLIYTLLFLPSIIWFLAGGAGYNDTLTDLSFILYKLSPLADLSLYIFIRKESIDKLLASVCCCRMDSNDVNRPEV